MNTGATKINGSSRRQAGVVLISTMLLLLVLTIFALSMFRSYGLQEKIAGNVREKQRALQNAEDAQLYAETYLSNLTSTTPQEFACAGMTMTTSPNLVQICTNPMTPANILLVPWAAGFQYNDPTSYVMSGSAATDANAYYSYPVFYITDLGVYGFGEIFQVDAWSNAAAQSTTAIVESTYLVKPAVPCLTCYAGTGG